VQRLADRVAGVFVPIVIVLAIGTTLFWLARGQSAAYSIGAGVAVLVIACPCALGLATPTALLAGTGRGAELGLLIHGPEILESARGVDTIIFDKTGTLTTGAMEVIAVRPASGSDERELLTYAGAVEAASEHPIGRAIAAYSNANVGSTQMVDDFVAEAGIGVRGVVDGVAVQIGRAGDGTGLAGTVVEVVAAGRLLGWIAVADALRPSSIAAVAELRAMGLQPVLVTGDNEETARAVALAVGIGDVEAGVRPEQKLDAVLARQAKGQRVAFVGDGVNDAAALAAADLGIAMGTGTDVARQASDLTLVHADLADVAAAINLSRRTLATIKTNLFWAFAYNVAAVPLAASGRLSPLVASGAMAFSSVFVVSNSVRLRRFRRDSPR
jgi:Cu+-exporting ATPase